MSTTDLNTYPTEVENLRAANIKFLDALEIPWQKVGEEFIKPNTLCLVIFKDSLSIVSCLYVNRGRYTKQPAIFKDGCPLSYEHAEYIVPLSAILPKEAKSKYHVLDHGFVNEDPKPTRFFRLMKFFNVKEMK